MNKIALIPSYEPDDKIIKLVNELSKNDFKIVVVDDGSGKDYENIFNKLDKAHVISYKTNKGKGHALKTGYKYIKDKYKDYIIITMDSDGQHTIKDANRIYEEVLKDDEYLILGKRPRGEKTPLRSKIGNSITMFIYRLTTGVKIYDTQTGLRGFSNKLMDYMLEIEGERFEYEMNVLLYLNTYGIKYREIEIETIYIDNNSHSHFSTFKDSYRVYKEIFKFSGSSLTCFIIDYALYTILFLLSTNIIFSNIGARIVSASVNYTINKKIVFKSKKNFKKTLIQYILLAICILVLNTCILSLLVKLGIGELIAKVFTEIILSIISFVVQKRFIF